MTMFQSGMPTLTTTAHEGPRLGEFILANLRELVTAWEERIRSFPVAERLPELALRDHIPELLSKIARIIETEGAELNLGELPQVHALQRLVSGFDLQSATEELAILRKVVLDEWFRHSDAPHAEDVVRFNRAIDETIIQSVGRFARSRERTLIALDRVSSAALGTGDLNAFLPRLLRVVLETTEPADAVCLFLIDGDEVVLAASVGLEEEIGLRVKIGEGFAGRVAQTRTPHAIRDASTDPLVVSKSLRAKQIHALYGVPMIHDGEVVGVARMGSHTAYEFSDDDKQLFRAMAQRATSLIVQAKLVHEREETIKELTRQRALLEERTDFEEQLVGIVSHDLRNPLHAILMSTGALLNREELDAKTTKAVARIQSAAQRSTRLIRDLLDFTRARLSGGIPLQRAEVDLHSVARSVADEVHLVYPDRDLNVEKFGEAVGCCWDADRLAQIISNLVVNAIKYSAPGSKVSLRTRGDGDDAFIEVHNTGNPITADQIPSLFQPMKRGPDLKREGLGLGLFIVDQLVKAHGGQISVRSTPTDGTTFTVKLPRGPVEVGEQAATGPGSR